ncbi:MAG TPA: hypothetical protein VF742_11595, partial [Terracidiphilus sp.]
LLCRKWLARVRQKQRRAALGQRRMALSEPALVSQVLELRVPVWKALARMELVPKALALQAPAQMAPVWPELVQQELARRVPAERPEPAELQRLVLVGSEERWLGTTNHRRKDSAWLVRVSWAAVVGVAGPEAVLRLPAVVRLEPVAEAAERTWLRVPLLLRRLSGARSVHRPRYRAFPGESESC